MMPFQMKFHTKRMNVERPSHNVKRVPKPAVLANPNASSSPVNQLFTGSSMIERVNKANSSCKHCGGR
jgi:hypothetical protein